MDNKKEGRTYDSSKTKEVWQIKVIFLVFVIKILLCFYSIKVCGVDGSSSLWFNFKTKKTIYKNGLHKFPGFHSWSLFGFCVVMRIIEIKFKFFDALFQLD